MSIGKTYFNYAAFYGNSETALLTTNDASFGVGQDQTNYKLWLAHCAMYCRVIVVLLLRINHINVAS